MCAGGVGDLPSALACVRWPRCWAAWHALAFRSVDRCRIGDPNGYTADLV